MSQMEAELKLPHVQNSQSRVVASLMHIANCPSNVRWRRLQTARRFGDNMIQDDQCDWTQFTAITAHSVCQVVAFVVPV